MELVEMTAVTMTVNEAKLFDGLVVVWCD